MSQGIMERNLPVAESIGEGDKVRIVTSAGNSKNVDASLIGVGMKIEYTDNGDNTYTLNRTYNELLSAIQNGIPIYSVDTAFGRATYCTFYSGNPVGVGAKDFLFVAFDETQNLYVATIYLAEFSEDVAFVADNADTPLVYTSDGK